MPARQQRPRGRSTPLQTAAFNGSTSRVVALLSSGSVPDIDDCDVLGCSALIYAASQGHTRIVEVLLDKGADTSKATCDGFTALGMAAQDGHLAVVDMLVKAGADLKARTGQGCTVLHLCGESGHAEAMAVLIEAGANPNSATPDGTTPLYLAASRGRLDAVKVLLRAKASPLLTATHPSGKTYVPLDTAAQYGHPEVVRELIEQCGIKGCGGASSGLDALHMAAQEQHLDIMAMLADAGVVDKGIALIGAAGYGREASIQFLMQQPRLVSKAAYVNTRDGFGTTALICSIEACCSCSPRIVRILVNAGADTTSPVRVTNTPGGLVVFNDSPVGYAARVVREKRISGRDATEEQLARLEAIHRLLLRVEAVHAVSWLWRFGISSVGRTVEGSSRTKTASAQLTSTLPMTRIRARRRGVILPVLFRYSSRP